MDVKWGLVLDDEERNEIELNEYSLCMCVVYNSRNVRVRAMEMMKQRGKKN